MLKINFYDNLNPQLFSTWWMYMVLGLNFVLLAILIMLFPDLLSYLVATFLLLNGIFFMVIAISTKRIRKKHDKWKESHVIPIK